MNGIYDILCTWCIMYYKDSVFGYLHSGMFQESEKLNKRYLAYSILTYNIIRYISKDKMILCSTYIIEAFVFFDEYYTCILSESCNICKECNQYDVAFVSIFSLIIAYAIYTNE
jgi:hypothetical protein